MSEKTFVSRDENLVMDLRFPGGGGVGVSIRGWDGDDWTTLFDKLVFADDRFGCVYGALCEIGFSDDDAAFMCSDWGFEMIHDEEDN